MYIFERKEILKAKYIPIWQFNLQVYISLQRNSKTLKLNFKYIKRLFSASLIMLKIVWQLQLFIFNIFHLFSTGKHIILHNVKMLVLAPILLLLCCCCCCYCCYFLGFLKTPNVKDSSDCKKFCTCSHNKIEKIIEKKPFSGSKRTQDSD